MHVPEMCMGIVCSHCSWYVVESVLSVGPNHFCLFILLFKMYLFIYQSEMV